MAVSEKEGDSLVVIMDEKGTRCAKRVPKNILKSEYAIERLSDFVTLCRKISCGSKYDALVRLYRSATSGHPKHIQALQSS